MEKTNCTRATAACLRPCSHQGGYERGEKQAPNQERKQSSSPNNKNKLKNIQSFFVEPGAGLPAILGVRTCPLTGTHRQAPDVTDISRVVHKLEICLTCGFLWAMASMAACWHGQVYIFDF
jgi:hypothetical protein